MKVSARLSTVPPSPIRKLVPLAVKAKQEGVKVYYLNIGDPDISTPAVMISALRQWKINPIGYGHSQGEPVFLKALRSYYHRIGFPFIKTEHLIATLGGSEAISIAMFSVTNPGDEILTFEPLYSNYNSYAAVNGVKLVAVSTTINTGFHLPSQTEIEKRITKKTKAILYCNPNNPTGTVYTKEEIDMLVALAKKHELYLLADEVYREYTYDKRIHVSLFSYMKDIPSHAIVLDSMSKRYSVCGLRIGALISLNADIMAGALRVAQGRLSAGLVDQHIAAKLIAVPKKYFRDTHREYERRRDVVYEALKKIPGITIPKPEGAFYVIVGLPVADSERFSQWLLTDFRDHNETVMVAPAVGFYATKGRGKNEIRIANVLSTKHLKRCIDLLRIALKVYNKA